MSKAIQFGLSAESKKTIAKLSTADFKPEIRKGLRDASAPLQAAVRNAVRHLPASRKRSKDSPGGSLRSAVASAVVRRIKVTPTEQFVIIMVRPRGGKSNLARALEGEIPWAHPTYGHEPVVTQDPQPFFYSTIETKEPGMETAIEHILSAVDKQL